VSEGRKRLLGLDLGTKTIGVAASDELGWAHPVTTVRRKSLAHDLEQLRQLCRQREIEGIVLGLPFNMDGTEGPRAKASRTFAVTLERELGLPVALWDERLSTFEAELALREAEVSAKRRREIIDQAAAVVILRSYLEAQPEGRER
jgi:putative Holliday junction resolvase